MPVLLLLFLTLLSVKVFVSELYHEGVTVITLVYIPFYSFIVMNGDIRGGYTNQCHAMRTLCLYDCRSQSKSART